MGSKASIETRAEANDKALTANKKTFVTRLNEDKWLLVFLLPTIILLFMFAYLPYYGLVIAFQNYKPGMPMLSFDGSITWVGFKHFIKFFQSIFFARVFGNTIRLSLLNLAFGFWVPIVFALLLNEIRQLTYKRIAQTFAYLPYFVSWVIVVSILFSLTSTHGVVNRVIGIFGGEPASFFQDSKYFNGLYVSSVIWKTFGYQSILYLAAIAGVDPELYAAVEVDGGNRFHKMWHVTMPCLLPTIVILLVLACGRILLSNTEMVLLMYNSSIYDKADIIGTYVYRTGLINARYSYTAAVGLFANILNFVLVYGTNMLSRRLTNYSLW